MTFILQAVQHCIDFFVTKGISFNEDVNEVIEVLIERNYSVIDFCLS